MVVDWSSIVDVVAAAAGVVVVVVVRKLVIPELLLYNEDFVVDDEVEVLWGLTMVTFFGRDAVFDGDDVSRLRKSSSSSLLLLLFVLFIISRDF